MESPYLSKEGRKAFILGNEAVARGLIEANVQFAASYPGTPAGEILECLHRLKSKPDIPVLELSVNEKFNCKRQAVTGLS